MLRIQKRLDVIIAVTSEDLENRREGISDSLAQKKEDFTASITTRVEDLKSNIEGKLESFRTSAQKSPNQYLESVKNEVAELRQKYTRSVADREKMCIRDSSMDCIFRTARRCCQSVKAIILCTSACRNRCNSCIV